MTTYYDILGVAPTASPGDIKAAYRHLAMQFHPDRTLGANEAVQQLIEDKFKEVQEAYDTLKDEAKRAEYDAALAMLNSGEYYEQATTAGPARTASDVDTGTKQQKALTRAQLATCQALANKIAALGFRAAFQPPVSEGPIVTLYRFVPQGSTRVSQIEGMADDFAIALGVEDVVAKRIPGEAAVGIYVPNRERKPVLWRDLVRVEIFKDKVDSLSAGEPTKRVPLLLGVDHVGRVAIEDLISFPHLLIAGSTGSGKTALLNSLLVTIVYNVNSDDVRFVLSDTKGVEFGYLVGTSHLLFDEPATSVYQTLEQLDWVIDEMSSRLKQLGAAECRDILEHNATHSPGLPYILIVIDELADLLSDRRPPEQGRGPSLGKIAEGKLAQLAQRARATGIHIIAATQRPDLRLVERNIKANFPARITFRLPSEADSRTVIGTSGAEHLLPRGDMLFINPNRPGFQRIHAPVATLEELKAAIELAQRMQA